MIDKKQGLFKIHKGYYKYNDLFFKRDSNFKWHCISKENAFCTEILSTETFDTLDECIAYINEKGFE